LDEVVAAVAAEHVVAVVARQRVVVGAAVDAFHVQEGVGAGAAGGASRGQVDVHGGSRLVVADDVEAAAPVDGVVAVHALEQLGNVRAVAAGERIVVRGAAHMVDVDQRVVAGRGAGGGARGQVDGDRGGGPAVARAVGVDG